MMMRYIIHSKLSCTENDGETFSKEEEEEELGVAGDVVIVVLT